ncbi:predicted protein [Chaetoceros tenuissimus]|uniref:Uncharacterized protein n=1 Tax=Chaetoceros tenuissimus TaxID=426638 RepID=A0AAD3CML9_9STRA|nr:predicted protein [Chaetoceros tenuissimus]
MTIKVRCKLANDLDPSLDANHKTFFCTQEENKKSSFVYNSDGLATSKLEKPCHLIIDCSPSEQTDVGSVEWLFGGLEIESNSRNVEIYAVVESKEFANREYWQTQRGTRLETESPSGEEIYSTIVFPPESKPIVVKSLHMKLLSLRPAKCTELNIERIKVKGRIPEGEIVEEPKATPSPPVDTNMTPIQPNGVDTSTAQIGKAVSAITMMLQSMESKMSTSVQSTIGEFQKTNHAQDQAWNIRMSKLEDNMQHLTNSMRQLHESVDSMKQDIQKLSLQKEEESPQHGQDSTLSIEQVQTLLTQEREMYRQELAQQRQLMMKDILEALKSEEKPTRVSTTVEVENDETQSNDETPSDVVEEDMECKVTDHEIIND